MYVQFPPVLCVIYYISVVVSCTACNDNADFVIIYYSMYIHVCMYVYIVWLVYSNVTVGVSMGDQRI